MSINRVRTFITSLLLVVLFLFNPLSIVRAAAPSGAIFTTNDLCDGTNINIYFAKEDVYLDGGPTHPGAAGLPDGEYYVQVTEPNGTLLGTSLGTLDETPVLVVDGSFINCYQLWDILIKNSDGTEGYDTTSNPGGEYKAWISTEPTFTNSNTKTDNFKVDLEPTPEPSSTPNPSPTPSTARLRVQKFYDANANGINDDGQPILGWKIRIQDGIDWIRYTLVDMIVAPDTYTITEFMPIETNWISTTLNPVVTTLNAGDDTLVEFGNLCTGAGGGHTKGYWSNKNGFATMNDGGTVNPELAMLSGLNLRNYNGSNFDPTTYSQFKTWLSNANAVNMSYMLSAQLSAMELNVESGMVSGSALVYAPQLLPYGITNPLGFISINDLMTASNTELGVHGTAWSGDSWRNYQDALKNTLDSANNNVNFVQSTPCPFSFE